MTATTPGSCSNSQCDFPDVSCHLGHLNPPDCEHFKTTDMDEASTIDGEETSFPWTGRAFGLNDLRFIAGCRKPLTIGVIGLQNAGKTTLLAMLFLMFSRGITILECRRFAGSYTLEGWENVARWLQLRPQDPIRFPPHTTSKGERTPGLLHLALADEHQAIRDVLVTDAPGEWFNTWAKNADAANAEGARWVSRSADRFLLIADTDALTGERSGPARNDFEWLARRLHGEARGRPVALVWTKTDLERPKQLTDAIELLFGKLFPGAPVFGVRVPPKSSDKPGDLAHVDDLTAVFAWAMADIRASGECLRPDLSAGDDAFLAFGAV